MRHDLWQQARLGVKPPRTWEQAVHQYNIAKGSKRSIGDDVTMLVALAPTLDRIPLGAIGQTDIEDAIDAAQRVRIAADAKKGKRPKPMSQARRNRYRAVCRHLLRLAHREWEWIDRAPVIALRAEPMKEPRWLTPTEAQTLVDASPVHWHAPIRFALATGLRFDNVFGLQWSWVDLRRRVIVIPGARAKGKRAITVPLNDSAFALLAGMTPNAPHVFLYRDRPFRPAADHWATVCRAAGLPGVTFHTLRHTWASWHIMSGTSLYDLMHLGGWTSFSMVKRYAHLDPGHLAAAAGNISTKMVPVDRGVLPKLPAK